MTIEKLAALLAAASAVVVPVLIQDHVVSGPVADVLGALVGAFVVGVHVPGSFSVPPAKSAPVKVEPAPTTPPSQL